MLSIIVRIPILNSQCIYFVHSKMIRNAHRLLNSMAVHPGPLPQERGKHAQVPEFSRPLVWNCFMGTHVGCYEVHAEDMRRHLSEMNSACCRSCVRQFADQPAVFAARRLFHIVHFAESDLEIIAQLAPNAFLDSRETRGMKPRSGHVTEFSHPRLFLAELHGV